VKKGIEEAVTERKRGRRRRRIPRKQKERRWGEMRRRAQGPVAALGQHGGFGGLPSRLVMVVLLCLLCVEAASVSAFQHPPSSTALLGRRARGRGFHAALSLGNGDAASGMQGQGAQDGSAVSPRLQKARLRLAEAQGIIPAGSSDRYQSPGGIKVRLVYWLVNIYLEGEVRLVGRVGGCVALICFNSG
jgi:hypothetical protein